MRFVSLVILALLIPTFVFLIGRDLYGIKGAVSESVPSKNVTVAEQRYVFETREATQSPDSGQGEYVNISALNGEMWRSMSGFPSYAKMSFPLPQDREKESGQIVLKLSTVLSSDSQGELRFNINGVQRAKILLDPGVANPEVVLPLRKADLQAGNVIVSLAAIGRTGQDECQSEFSTGALVEIDRASRLELVLNGDPLSFRDQLLVAGDPAAVAWPIAGRDDAPAEGLAGLQAQILADTLNLRLAGRSAFFSDAVADTINLAGKSDSVMDFLQASERRPIASESLDAVISEAALFDTRMFDRKTSWQLPVRLMENGRFVAPAGLHLALKLGALPPEDYWSLGVLQNGRLIHSEITDAGTRLLDRTIPVPADTQTYENMIEIRLEATRTQQFRCGEYPTLYAQIEPATAFTSMRGLETLSESRFYEALANADSIGIEIARPLELSSANAGYDLIGKLVGRIGGKEVKAGVADAGLTAIVGPAASVVDKDYGASPRWLFRLAASLDPNRVLPVSIPLEGNQSGTMLGSEDLVVMFIASDGD